MIYKLLSALLISLAATAVFGLILVPALRKLKAGQSIREDGPIWHKKKQGTPTMGGLMMIFGVSVTCLTVGFYGILSGNYEHIIVLAFSLVYACIGFLDDFEKLKKKQNLGLTATQKFILQLEIAITFIILMRYTGNLVPNLYIPFVGVTVAISEPVYLVVSSFIIVGCVNAVNITDGVDGLVTGVTLPVAIFYTVISAIWGYAMLGIFAAALTGALAAFLFFNFHPAKVFMGDTGSLFLGAAVCGLAFALDIPLILLPLGFVYIVETLSDIIQIIYFKATHGKRIFKMAPLHHHFEMSGWSEYKLFAVFTAVSALFAVISYFGVYLKYVGM